MITVKKPYSTRAERIRALKRKGKSTPEQLHELRLKLISERLELIRDRSWANVPKRERKPRVGGHHRGVIPKTDVICIDCNVTFVGHRQSKRCEDCKRKNESARMQFYNKRWYDKKRQAMPPLDEDE